MPRATPARASAGASSPKTTSRKAPASAQTYSGQANGWMITPAVATPAIPHTAHGEVAIAFMARVSLHWGALGLGSASFRQRLVTAAAGVDADRALGPAVDCRFGQAG